MDEYEELIKQGKYTDVLMMLENKKDNTKNKISDFPDLVELMEIEKKYNLDKTQTDILDNEDYTKMLKENLNENFEHSLILKTFGNDDESRKEELEEEEHSIHIGMNRETILKKIEEANKFSINTLIEQNEKLVNNLTSLNEGNQMELEDIMSNNYMQIIRKQLFPYKDYSLPFFEHIKEKVDINFYKTDITEQVKAFDYDNIFNTGSINNDNFAFPSPEDLLTYTKIEDQSNCLKDIDMENIINFNQTREITYNNKKVLKKSILEIINSKNNKKGGQIGIEIMYNKVIKSDELKESNLKNKSFKNSIEEFITKKSANIKIIKDSEMFCNQLLSESIENKNISSAIVDKKNQDTGTLLGLSSNTIRINFEGNLIADISDIGKFDKLTDINLGNNQIKEIPICFKNLINLVNLNLEKNRIVKIENLENCKNLRSINLNNNLIEKLMNLSENKLLEKLSLVSNKISKIENLDNNINLIELNLSKNLIKDIKYVSKLFGLESLFLYKNYIEEVEDLSLPFIKELYLNNNKLKKFCPGSCFFLKELFLYNNFLERIESLKECQNLKTLDLSFNQINSFANIIESIKNNRNISKLSIQENPFFKYVNEDFNIYRKILCRILPLKYLNYKEITNKTLVDFRLKINDDIRLFIPITENYHNLNESFRNIFRRIINKIKDEFDVKKFNNKLGRDYSFIENNYIKILNQNLQLRNLHNLHKIIDNLDIEPYDMIVISFNKVYFTLSQIFLNVRKYRIEKILKIQRNTRLYLNKKTIKLIVLIQKNFRGFRVYKRIKKLKQLKFDEEDDLFNIDEMEKHFNENFFEEKNESIKIDNFDLNKFIQEVNLTSQTKKDSKNPHYKTIRKEEIPLPKKAIKEVDENKNHTENKNKETIDITHSKQTERLIKKTNEVNNTVSLRNSIELNKKKDFYSNEIDKVISDIKQRNDGNTANKKENDNVKFPIIEEKKVKSQNTLEEDSRIRGKSINTQNNDIKLPLLNNNYNYNIINNNSKISDISMLSEKSKISSHTNDSRNSKLTQKSKVITPTSIMSNNQIDANKLKGLEVKYIPGNLNETIKKIENNEVVKQEIEKWNFRNEETKKNFAFKLANFSHNKSKKLIEHVKLTEGGIFVQKYNKKNDR